LPSSCRAVTAANFNARLDLHYFYLLEYDTNNTEAGTATSSSSNDVGITDYLPRFDHAVATALVQRLSECVNSDDPPLYGVLLSNHELSLGGTRRTRGVLS
jgi:hypothetical protein